MRQGARDLYTSDGPASDVALSIATVVGRLTLGVLAPIAGLGAVIPLSAGSIRGSARPALRHHSVPF